MGLQHKQLRVDDLSGVILGIYWGHIGVILGLYRSYIRVVLGVILGLHKASAFTPRPSTLNQARPSTIRVLAQGLLLKRTPPPPGIRNDPLQILRITVRDPRWSSLKH